MSTEPENKLVTEAAEKLRAYAIHDLALHLEMFSGLPAPAQGRSYQARRDAIRACLQDLKLAKETQ